MADAPAPAVTTPTRWLRMTPEGRLWLAVTLLLGGVGWYKSIILVQLLGYLMLTLFVLNGYLALRMARQVAARREPISPLFAGEDSVIRVAAANTGERGVTVTVTDSAGDIEPARWLVHRLKPGASIVCSAHRTFPRRGRFPGSVQVACGSPFGLLQYERSEETVGDLVVLPAAGEANAEGLRQWLIRHVRGDGRARKVLRRVTTDLADVRGVRPYRPGDPIRSVHWRSSARRRELMVREYDAAPTPELVVVVEPWLPANATPRQREQLEAALSLAVTIVRTWSRGYGTRVTIVVAGDPDSVRTTSSTDDGVRTALAPLAGVVGAATFAAFGPNAFERSLTRAARVVVSSRPGSPLADALTRSTGWPFVAVSPADNLPWYQPPESGVRSRGSGVGGQESVRRAGIAHAAGLDESGTHV